MFRYIIIALLIASSSALYPTDSKVKLLTRNNFDKKVTQSERVWLIEFFAPWCGHCQNFALEYEKVAMALRGVARVGAINADENPELAGRFAVGSYPTLKIFGASKYKPEDYKGPRTVHALVDAVMQAIKQKVNMQSGRVQEDIPVEDGDVVVLTDGTFNEIVLNSESFWLVEFYAPWCGHCKNLAPEFAKAAKLLEGKAKLGAIDATIHNEKAQEYGVSGYPTLKYFKPGSRLPDHSQDYDGGRSAAEIVDWVKDKLKELGPPPNMEEVISAEVFNESCENHLLCVITILPHILDCQSKCRMDYLNLFKNISEGYKSMPWGWVWAEAGSQPDLEAALEIGGFGYPAIAVLNAKKLKYVLMKGSFSKEGISEFLSEVSLGKGTISPIRGAVMPNILDITAWDGNDAETEKTEDEFGGDGEIPEKDEL